MAIPYTPQNLVADQTDGNILITWTAILNAVSYSVQRSTDGVNFLSYATSTVPFFEDVQPGIGIQYWYQVAIHFLYLFIKYFTKPIIEKFFFFLRAIKRFV